MILLHRGYEIDDTSARIDFAQVHDWLSGTYWSPGISRERVERGARHSAVVVGAYREGVQVGFLRVVSDTTRFAYISDVFVEEAHRGQGLARAMVRFAIDHPDLEEVSRWLLATRDAQEVYRGVGFEPIQDRNRWMLLQPKPTAATAQTPGAAPVETGEDG